MNNFEKTPEKEVPRFEKMINKDIVNYNTQEGYKMTGGEDMDFSPADISKIAEICAQEGVYKTLFEKRWNGDPYTEKDAAEFVDFVKEGWKNKTYFVFFVRKEDGEIIGAIDIKSADLERAEVGYWADKNYKGFMTNTLMELSKLAKSAGFMNLFATTATTNVRSGGVLERAGFHKVEKADDAVLSKYEYEKELQ